MKLNEGIKNLSGVGEKKAKSLEKLDIKTIRDLLYYLPRGYKDLSHIRKLNDVKMGETALFEVKIFTPPKTRRIRKNLEITSFEVSDENMIVNLDIFNQVYIKTYLNQGDTIYVYGKHVYMQKKVGIISPEIYFKKPQDPFFPLYPLTAGITQNYLRKLMKAALDGTQLQELYSQQFLEKFELMDIRNALYGVHFPNDVETAGLARTRLVFDELLIFCRMLEMLDEETADICNVKVNVGSSDIKEFVKMLPFFPTKAQGRVMEEICEDLCKDRSMNRLIQGDVGSGKTVLAFFAMYCLQMCGYQSVMLAPTEILAEQHYHAAKKYFPEDEVVLISGALTAKQKRTEIGKIESGEAKIIIGTHALIYAEINYRSLGLLITDEQHRFGVKQRAAIAGAGKDIHTLIMSATPIPRSLALVLYGKTAISIVDELPPGRKEIKTYLIRQAKYETMISFVRDELKKGRQAYIVCPLIEDGMMEDVKSAQTLYEEIGQMYNGFETALLHGKMKHAEKQEIMQRFARGEINALVSTTVIEVGINVPNASVMVVQNAERFGLAQLHQLRGRVGRGAEQSYCFMVSDHAGAFERLRVMVGTNDGFEIAEKDMQLRGIGDMLGTKQHGKGMLKIADLIGDMRQLDKARKVLDIMKNSSEFGVEYKNLTATATQMMKQKMLEIALN